MRLTRRALITGTAGAAALGGASLACASDGGADDESCPGGPDIEILDNGNDKHALAVPVADIEAGSTKTYGFTSSVADHTHEVTITQDHFAKLAEDGFVSVLSETASGHDHQVIIMC